MNMLTFSSKEYADMQFVYMFSNGNASAVIWSILDWLMFINLQHKFYDKVAHY
jgi:ABC-type uncharacterized transport system YnjBCD substrate-binding protein